MIMCYDNKILSLNIKLMMRYELIYINVNPQFPPVLPIVNKLPGLDRYYPENKSNRSPYKIIDQRQRAAHWKR